jgi:hypothetical protein
MLQGWQLQIHITSPKSRALKADTRVMQPVEIGFTRPHQKELNPQATASKPRIRQDALMLLN